MEKKEKKKKNIGIDIFIGTLLAVIICIIVGISVYNADYMAFNDRNNETKETEDNNKKENDTTASLDFNTSNISNGEADSYTLSNYNGTINITVDETGKIATLSYNRKTLSDTYLLNWDLTGVEDGVMENQTITFNTKINDVVFGGIGQDATGDVILFLMEDGTVAYIPVYQTLSNSGIESITSYETIDNLSDIVKFYTANATSGTSSSVTVLAQAKDGTLYDLAPIINDASNNQ